MASRAGLEPRSQQPFYTTITNVKEVFTDGQGKPASVDLPLVTLPAGTVLFRGIRIPNVQEGEDVRYFYRDFLGDPEGTSDVCLSPTHNVFFYPIPYVMFGAHNVGSTFQSIQMVVLVHPITVVCSISPSKWVRGITNRFGGSAPYQKCSTVRGDRCHRLSAKEEEALKYDNCLTPEYQKKSGTRGWMAIADLDSINPMKIQGDGPMLSYIQGLEKRMPGEGGALLASLYTDDNRHAGYPEIAMYPYKNHKGLLTRKCRTERNAISLIAEEAGADNLNYLPIATITKDGVIDMVGGHFMYDRLSVKENTFTRTAANQQPEIEGNLRGLMKRLESQGITLPFYGKGTLSFDMRTGFYVLPQVLQQKESLYLPLRSPQEKWTSLTYSLLFRTFMSSKYMEVEESTGLKRAMIFNRPPVLAEIFKKVGIEMPKGFSGLLGRAAGLFKKNMTPVAKAAAAPASLAARPASLTLAARPASLTLAARPASLARPTAASLTERATALEPAQRQYEESVRLSKVASRKYPTFEESLDTYPPYVAPPPAPPPNTSLPPWKRGGTRSAASKNSKSKTRKSKSRRSHASFARLFRDVWKQHVQVKHQ